MEKLKLGVAREIITPKVGGRLAGYGPNNYSQSVADDLTATAFYFQQGETGALMISLTVVSINTELAQSIRAAIEEKFHIPKENCMLCATHTHSGPDTNGQVGWGGCDGEYCNEIFIPAILSATEKAMNSIQPVKMGVATGTSLVGINRRELTEDNRVVLGQNPWGSFNSDMTVISFADLAGKNVANMIHYGAHCTAAGVSAEITRDWAGIMIDALEEQSGAVTAFFNGPEGDVGPRLSNQCTTGDMSYVRELGEIAAKDAIRIFREITQYQNAELAVSNKNLQLPLKKRVSVEEAQRMSDVYKNSSINWQVMLKNHFDDVVRSYQEGYVDKETTAVEQTAIAVGDVVFAAFPYEPFAEIGLRINKAVKTKTVLSLSNTNGSEGYFITRDAVCRGGYEVNMFLHKNLQPYHDDVDFYLIKETVNHVKDLINEEE